MISTISLTAFSKPTSTARLTIACADPELRAMLEQSQADIGSVTRASQILVTDADAGFDEIAAGLWMRIER